jgi:hypothetical protein
MSQNDFKYFRKILMALTFLLTLSPALTTKALSPEEIKKKEDDIRAVMFTVSRQLGVTCTTCHETDNFKNDKKQNYKISLEHMKITQLLIDKGFDGKKGPKADCYMCHRGSLKPAFKEPQNPMRE